MKLFVFIRCVVIKILFIILNIFCLVILFLFYDYCKMLIILIIFVLLGIVFKFSKNLLIRRVIKGLK